MNAVEIESALADLAEAPFDRAEFPFAFMEAFGNKRSLIDKLRKASGSDLDEAWLIKGELHVAVCDLDTSGPTLQRLRESGATAKQKIKFLVATDGHRIDAEDMVSGEVLSCEFTALADHLGFFLPLGGITTSREIKESPIDVRATGRLNKLYVELLAKNPEWSSASKQGEMNHFMARMVFCFFAEDTNIFAGDGLFTRTVEQMSTVDGANTHEVIETIFRTMNIRHADRASAEPRIPSWADAFPYVNGGLFGGSTEVPKFSRTAKSYLLRAGDLDWKQINPDIFGSMIQAVANADERSNLGMHYTSVPNILKVLNPLFLDELRERLEECGDNQLKLLNLRKRLAKIRVFDPACGSGNFLVIAYKQLREIEAVINKRRNETHLPTVIPLTNFRGIEINSFPAEIARLSLIITEFQCDVLYRGQQDAITEFLPLQKENWIICENALHVDWERVAPVQGISVDVSAKGQDDMFETRVENMEFDFDNEGGEGYVCGNPPYIGASKQNKSQKNDLDIIFNGKIGSYKTLDYVSGWFMKAAEYCGKFNASAALVTTNSICQGQQAPLLWPAVFSTTCKIHFAYESFKWSNLAAKKAGVSVVIVGLSARNKRPVNIYTVEKDDVVTAKICDHINSYLVNGKDIFVEKTPYPLSDLHVMDRGNSPVDGGNLLMEEEDYSKCSLTPEEKAKFIRRFYGSEEIIHSKSRFALWISDDAYEIAKENQFIKDRIERVKLFRLGSPKAATRSLASSGHKFGEIRQKESSKTLVVPAVSSENREYLPVGIIDGAGIVSNLAFSLFDAPLWNMAIIASRLHLVWIATVCGKLETRYRYSNTMGWNTFPVPTLTEQNKADLTRAAEDILMAREAHFPKTIGELYEPETMPENLRQAHERNDELLERIYIGRRFKNDTERLEKLFDMYTKMTSATKKAKAPRAKRATA